MKAVGIRELRQRASELLRLVEAGDTIEITDRGRPVALLSPIPQLTGYARLKADGDITPASASIDDLPPAIPLEPGQEPASAILARLRRDER